MYPAWQDFLGNPELTKALLSRLRERCHTVSIEELLPQPRQGDHVTCRPLISAGPPPLRN
jgi:hypothetical protein